MKLRATASRLWVRMSDKYKILVIEDEKDIRELTAEILKEEGYAVITANDGHDGVHAAGTHKPDVIILDIMMPRVDGVSACNSLRSQEQTRHIGASFFLVEVAA